MTPLKQVMKLLVCGLVAALPAAGAPRATSIIHVPFDEMVLRSGLIVRGTVMEMHVEVRAGTGRPVVSRLPKRGVPPQATAPGGETAGPPPEPVSAGLGKDGGPVPSTHITFLIEEVIKGAPSSRILRLRMPGGPLGNRWFTVVGLPRFEVRRSYYLFLRPDYKIVGDFVVGVDQGFFRIERDASTGSEMLSGAMGQIISGVENNIVVARAGARRQAPPLTPTGLTRLVRSVPGWDRRPEPEDPGGRP